MSVQEYEVESSPVGGIQGQWDATGDGLIQSLFS